jgi:vancomycin resistance protein YoaR
MVHMPGKAANMKLMKLMLLALGVLIVALIVVLILMMARGSAGGEDKQDAFIESNTYLKGISVAGVDISGLTFEEAAASPQLVALGRQVEDSFSYSFTVNDKAHTFSAAELGITSNLLPVLQEAMLFGQYGSEAREQKAQLSDGGKDFALAPFGDISVVTAKLLELKATTLDIAPQEAMVMVSGDVQGNEQAEYLYELEGVQIVDGMTGVDVDASALAVLICENIGNGNYASIEAPVILTEPNIGADDVRANTKRLSSRTTSYDGSTEDRVTNIRIMSGIVNGTVIRPGETWSINAAAGPRNATTARTMGWAEAHGITNGRYEDQYGGGVCQVSGTLYNAAILAELTITERRTHSWPSAYLPEGLDATINFPSGELDSSGTKDLKLTNPFDMPVYLVAYMDTNKKTLTIEVFGPPLAHGYTVQFVTIKVGSKNAPPTEDHYGAATLPDGTAISAGKSKYWVESRNGQTWQVWKQYVDEQGVVVRSVFFHEDSYPAFQGVRYFNVPDPLTVDNSVTTTG